MAIRLLIMLLMLAYAAPAQAQSGEPIAPLLDGLGDHHHEVTTDVPEAQRFFDQGLILAFAFNHAEAARSFREAQRLDPGCAMCYWGEALVLGPNINAAMDPADAPEAWAALQRARELAPNVSERELAYIDALSERYTPEAPEDRSPLDRAYAEAMGEVTAQHPDDLDAQVLYAEALMDTTPWDYWQPDGEPKPVTATILATLDTVLDRAPDHPMANHLYIHAVEAERPELGLEEAVRLEDLVPGAGHLVHMPAHIYIRTGRYHEASRANQRAIEADERYLDQVDAQGAYPLGYVPHNYHFLWSTATLEGRSEQAIQTAREMAALVDTSLMRERGLTTLQHYWITPLYALVRFGRWDEILDRAEPADDLVYPRGVWHYARGMALTRKGEFDAARHELSALRRLTDDPALEWVTVWDINKSRHILDIATHALAGELAAAAGELDAAIASLERAVEREDALNYDEPPTWHYPTRQSLGAVLLQAGRPAEAAEIYRQDLDAFPENGWSLFGLLEALRRQGQADEVADVERRFREAWRHADVTLTSSSF
jgi:tetratricopeptide (TPR) repeat protein